MEDVSMVRYIYISKTWSFSSFHFPLKSGSDVSILPSLLVVFPFTDRVDVTMSGFVREPMGFKVFVYRSYHNSVDSMHPYRYLNKRRYSNLTPFSMRTFFLCYGFTSHMISKKSPSIFNIINFYFGVSALRYAPGTSKMATCLPSCASIMILVNSCCKDIVGDDASSLGIYHLCDLPSAHVPPFNLPQLFPFIKFIAHSAPLFCDFVRLSGSSAPITFVFSIWV